MWGGSDVPPFLSGTYYPPPLDPRALPWVHPAPPEPSPLTPAYSSVWLWLDAETTGTCVTSPNFKILEIACCVTDEDLTIIDTLHLIIHHSRDVLNAAPRWCVQHFADRAYGGNDLFAQCEASELTEAEAGKRLEEFIRRHARVKYAEAKETPKGIERRNAFNELGVIDASEETRAPKYFRVMLAGSSVHFDRSVLLSKFPRLRSMLSHKIIDISSLLEMTRRFKPAVLQGLPPPRGVHRAMEDIFESVFLFSWIQRQVFLT